MRHRLSEQTRLIRLLLLLTAGLLTLGVSATAVQDRLEWWMHDLYVRLSADSARDERIALVDVDEASLAEVAPWPWARATLADLVERLLAEYGAAAVALDIVLPEPADAAGDARLAALAEHGPVVLAVAFDWLPRHPPLNVGQPGEGRAFPWHVPVLQARGHLGNHPGLAQARCVGHIGYLPDADGVLRRLPFQVRYAGGDYLTLSAALLYCSGRLPAATVTQLDLDRQGLWSLRFGREPRSFTAVSAADVLHGRLPDGLLRGRLVIVGSSAVGLADRVATPLANLTSGFVVHASALSELLDRQGADWPGKHVLMIVSLWLGVVATLVAAMPARPLSPIWLGLPVLLLLGWALTSAVFWPHLTPRAAGLMATYHLVLIGLITPYEWWLSHRQARRAFALLAHYVAPAVLEELMRRPQDQPLRPQQHEITALVVDMAGYTRLTASLPLAEAAWLTKAFLAELTESVLAQGGTLDRYTGDGLVAFWGAPLRRTDHATAALRAALDILERLRRWRPPFLDTPVRVRIGMESGTALVGDLGTDFRSTYTAVGDCINLAAKLESAANDLGVALAIGPRAGEYCKRAGFELFALGELPLGGLRMPCWTTRETWTQT